MTSDLFEKLFPASAAKHSALERSGKWLKKAVLFGRMPYNALSCLLIVAQLTGYALFALPMPAAGQSLDLSGYEPVFTEEFDAQTLDTRVWDVADAPFCSPEQVQLHDGAAVLSAERRDGGNGTGWYAAQIALQKKYARGYFEVRCMCSEGSGFYSAVRIVSDPDEAQIDVFAADCAAKRTDVRRNAVTQSVRENGKSRTLGTFRADDIYQTYNTYGLEWTSDEAVFYVNGLETCRSSFSAGASGDAGTLVLSLCVPERDVSASEAPTPFCIDYVHIYQKPSDDGGSGAKRQMLGFELQRAHLSERLQTVYDSIYERAVRYKRFTVDFAKVNYSYDEFNTVIRAIKDDHPQFWLFLDSDESVRDEFYNGEHRYIDVFYAYLWKNNRDFFSPLIMDLYLDRIDRACDRIIDKMPAGLTRIEQYRYLCDALSEKTSYLELSGPNIESFSFCYANGPLLENAGLCQAYSQAYQWMCHRAGLPCATVDSNTLCHTWNLVQLENGATYHVDVTWYDGDNFSDEWFMFTQEEADATHEPNPWALTANGAPLA